MGDKRKKHAPGFKAKVAIDALRERESIREISTRYQVHATQVSLWKGQLQDGATGIFEHPADKRGLRPDHEVALYEQIGRLKMELEWLKKSSLISTADRRAFVVPSGRLSLTRQCQLLGLPRSSFYHLPAIETPENLGLMRKMGLEAIYPEPHTSTPGLGHAIFPYLLRAIDIRKPNQVWCSDITYIPMEKGFMYLVAVMDWFSRRTLAWRLSNTLTTDFCIDALDESFAAFGAPEIFNTDQGSQFTSADFQKRLAGHTPVEICNAPT